VPPRETEGRDQIQARKHHLNAHQLEVMAQLMDKDHDASKNKGEILLPISFTFPRLSLKQTTDARASRLMPLLLPHSLVSRRLVNMRFQDLLTADSRRLTFPVGSISNRQLLHRRLGGSSGFLSASKLFQPLGVSGLMLRTASITFGMPLKESRF
jgi:hypothetical protein